MGLPPANTEKGRLRGAALLACLALLAAPLTSAPRQAEAAETETFGAQPHPRSIAGQRRTGFRLGIAEGAAARDAVLVFNKTEEAIRLRVFATDFREGAPLPFGREPTGVGAWIQLEPQELELEPMERRVIEFAVARPDGTEPGSGAIVVEEIPREDRESSITIRFQVALELAVADSVEGPRVLVEDVRLEVPLRLVPSTGAVRARVVNATAVSLDSSLRVAVVGVTGRRFDLPPVDVDLEPGGEETYSIDWPGVPRWGGFLKAEAEVDWEGGTAVGASPRRVVVPIWLLLLFNAGVAFVWWRVRKRSPTSASAT